MRDTPGCGPVIVLDGVTVVREGRAALCDVSLEARSGEFVGIIGPNGAGKSTLLGVINGLLRPAKGRATVLGLDPSRPWDALRLRARVGLVPQVQRFNRIAPILALETVLLGRAGRRGLGRPFRRVDREIARRAMADTGVERLAERPLGTLSGGELQRVAIARALAQEPDILLLDEPTASVDPAAREGIARLLGELPRLTGAAILCVTHDPWMLPESCGRVAMLKRGSLVRMGPRDRILREGLLEELYAEEGGRFGVACRADGTAEWGLAEGAP